MNFVQVIIFVAAVPILSINVPNSRTNVERGRIAIKGENLIKEGGYS